MDNKDTAVSVEGNITPITRQPIQQVNAGRWNEMSVSDLYDQKTILDSRYLIAAQIGNHSLMNQLLMGISHLTAIINQKADKDITLI